jgi:hypothetical protein
MAAADLRRVGYRLDRDAAGFPLFPQIFAKLTHAPVPAQIRFGASKILQKDVVLSTSLMHNL